MRLLMAGLKRANPAMSDIACDIERACKRLWQSPQAPWFTDHGIGHSRRIGEAIEQILFGGAGWPLQLTAEELLVLIGACYLHDAGMQHTKSLAPLATLPEMAHGFGAVGREYESFVRPEHPAVLYRLIVQASTDDPHLQRFGLMRCPRKFQHAIADISLAHGRYGHLAKLRALSCPGLRLDLIGALLQVGDLLDITHRRVNPDIYSVVFMPSLSRSHWLASLLVTSVVIDSRGRILVTYGLPRDMCRDHALIRMLREVIETRWIEVCGREAFSHLDVVYGVRLTVQRHPGEHIADPAIPCDLPVRVEPEHIAYMLDPVHVAEVRLDSDDAPADGFLLRLACTISEGCTAVFGSAAEVCETDAALAYRSGLPMLAVRGACNAFAEEKYLLTKCQSRAPLWSDMISTYTVDCKRAERLNRVLEGRTKRARPS